MGLVTKDDGWRLNEALWVHMQPLLPELPAGVPQPAGVGPGGDGGDPAGAAHRAAVNALSTIGIGSSSSAYRWFCEWADAGVFEAFWRHGLMRYDELVGIDWRWLALDGAMTQAPLVGEKNRPQPHRSRQRRHQAQPAG